MMALRILVAMALVAATGNVSTTMSAQAADPAAALSGGWKLNMDASINPNGPDGAGARARGGRGSSAFPQPLRGPDPGGDLNEAELRRFNAHLAMFRHAPPLLGIKATAKDVLLAYDPDPAKGLIYKHNTDNKKAKLATPSGELEIKVKWDKGVLQREVESKESLKVVERYTVSPDGKQLVVTVETSNIMVRMQKVEIKRVYDRVQ